MTPKGILSLSGPALSEAVAEFVMAWQRETPFGADGTMWRDNKGERHATYSTEQDRAGEMVFRPHKDIRDAIMVVDRVVGLGFEFTAIKNGESWHVDFALLPGRHGGQPLYGGDLCVRICQAALIVMPAP